MVFGLIWFTEEGKLHLECTFLGFCTCVGLWFIERGMCGFALVGLWFVERGMCGFALVLVYGL